MSTALTKSGFAAIDNARIYYEVAGNGVPFVMIHAGVADSRQWNNEFPFFARKYRVLRYDQRGYGKSEPVDGEFSYMSDLVGLLETLEIDEPLIMMGCSMGGGLAIDFALRYPSKVKALILVGSAVSGLKLDVPTSPKFAEAEKAFEAGDMERVAELSTEIWFDGTGRTPEQVDPQMRKLCLEMNRIALAHETKNLGKRLPNSEVPAFDRLAELTVPVLLIVGTQDTPYILAATDYMVERISSVRKVLMNDAAHLPNMDHPREFQEIVQEFLKDLPG